MVALTALDDGTRSDSRIQRASAVRALASLGADAQPAVTRLTALLEPLLILLMVGLVLVIILATLTPLLQITGALN